MFRILIAEDDPSTARLLGAIVKRAGYEPLIAADGVQALEMLDHNQIDLLLCDVMMPRMDGFALTKAIRESGSMLPILMLTAKDMPQDKHTGFIVGTDDYMTKPFSMLELVSRIRALLRRTSNHKDDGEITVGKLTVNPEKHIVTANGKNVLLTYKEYHLLLLLMQNKGVVFSREKLLNKIWGYDFDGENRTVDVHIRTLRTKLGECGNMIETIRGFGYKIGE